MNYNSEMPKEVAELIKEQMIIYNAGREIEVVSKIPETKNIPIEDRNKWLKINDIICVYVDMKNSTKLSASLYDKSTAGAYQLYTETAIRLFNWFGASYIDVKGDGVFSLFNGNEPHRALAAAVSFRTFSENTFVKRVKSDTSVDVGSHVGIDCGTILVRKLGIKKVDSRTDRQNEVWAGTPVNMAAKLSSLSENNEILVSDRFFKKITNSKAIFSCGCNKGMYTGKKTELWTSYEISNFNIFDFDKAYKLKSAWCSQHGAEYCNELLQADTVNERKVVGY